MPDIEYRQYCNCVSISRDMYEAAKTYGPVRRGGRTSYRNYHRPIPHGLTFWEVVQKIRGSASDVNQRVGRLFRV